MRFFFLTLLLLALAIAHGRPLAAAPAASKKAAAPSVKARAAAPSVKARAAAPSAKARAAAPSAKSRAAAAAAPAASPWKGYAATSKLSAQFDALEPQGDVSIAAPADIKEAAAYAIAEIVAEATGSEEEARDAAQAAIEV